MSDNSERSLEGWVPKVGEELPLSEVIDLAFDYRGDVTLTLRSGEQVAGYLFNRDTACPQPVLHVFPEAGGTRLIAYADVATIAFTGEDTASGKSWEVWVAKKESQRKAERDRVAAEARARGHL